MENKKRILVVDDEADICSILKFNLEKAGYETSTACSAEEAIAMGAANYDLILLDVMMEGLSGFQMAEILKQNASTAAIPIIFVTARDTEDDTVHGLGLGADDYISKPFSNREVISRVKAVLRRAAVKKEADVGANILRHDTLIMDIDRKAVTIDGKAAELTRTEFEILHLLIGNPFHVYSRDDILSMVWPDEVIVLGRTVDVNITRLRKKLGRYGQCIVTRHGYGYCFEE